MCGRTAVIPLRITMLYARDGDRWVPMFEHMSFGHTPAPRRDGQLYGTPIASKVVASPDFVDRALERDEPGAVARRAIAPRRSRPGPRRCCSAPTSTPSGTARTCSLAQLVPGPARNVEDRRIGFVGRSLAAGDDRVLGRQRRRQPAGATGHRRGQGPAAHHVRVREAADDHGRWRGPGGPAGVDARARATAPTAGGCSCRATSASRSAIRSSRRAVFGTALLSPNLESGEPLQVTCDDGARALTAPAAAPPQSRRRRQRVPRDVRRRAR